MKEIGFGEFHQNIFVAIMIIVFILINFWQKEDDRRRTRKRVNKSHSKSGKEERKTRKSKDVYTNIVTKPLILSEKLNLRKIPMQMNITTTK